MLRRKICFVYILASIYLGLVVLAWTCLVSSGWLNSLRALQGRETREAMPDGVASLTRVPLIERVSKQPAARRMLFADDAMRLHDGLENNQRELLHTFDQTNFTEGVSADINQRNKRDRSEKKPRGLKASGNFERDPAYERSSSVTQFRLMESTLSSDSSRSLISIADAEGASVTTNEVSPERLSDVSNVHPNRSRAQPEEEPIFVKAMRTQYRSQMRDEADPEMKFRSERLKDFQSESRDSTGKNATAGKTDTFKLSRRGSSYMNAKPQPSEDINSSNLTNNSQTHAGDRTQLQPKLRLDNDAQLNSASKTTRWTLSSRTYLGTNAIVSKQESDDCRTPLETRKSCLGTSDASSRSVSSKCSLEQLTLNCRALRKAHRYDERHTDGEELAFPLAFSIKMHTAPEQAEQLLRTIYRPHNVYCIHVDKKADDVIFRTMTSLSKCFDNVIVVRDRVNVVYASSGFVQAELRCMEAVQRSSVPWKYYINLAGQEFPLRTNLEMVRILKMFNGANDIESYSMPSYLRWRIEQKFRIDSNILLMTNERKEKHTQYQIRKGSAYGAFSRAFVTSVLTDHVAQSIIQWFNDTYAPEENVWATINSLPWIPGGYPIDVRHDRNQHASRAVAWQWDAYTCKGEYQRGVCVFTKADLPWLMQRPHLVANKFMSEKDQDVLDCLEETLFRRARTRPVSVDLSYFENLPHVKFYNRGQSQ